jgi:hypothetical protein
VTLSELQASAVRLGEELYQARYNGTEPPTHEELTEFLVEVEQGTADDCSACGEVVDAARAFSICLSRNVVNVEETREALAVLLDESGVFGGHKHARRAVADFCSYVIEASKVPA